MGGWGGSINLTTASLMREARPFNDSNFDTYSENSNVSLCFPSCGPRMVLTPPVLKWLMPSGWVWTYLPKEKDS